MKRKRITLRDTAESQNKNEYDLSFKNAYEYFLSAKKSEGLIEKTLISYDEHFRFFCSWLEKSDYEISNVNEVELQDVEKFRQLVLDNDTKRNHTIITLLAYTGVRISEALYRY